MYIEETGGDDPVGNQPFHDPVSDSVSDGDIDGDPGSAGVGGEDAGIAGRGGSLLLDTPQGVRDVGPATEDTNGNGRPDTAVVDEGRGMLLVTDMDGDFAADQTVRIEDTGGVTVSRHTGPGQWTVVEQRGVGQGPAQGSGQDAPDAAGEPVPAGGGGSAPSSSDDAAWALGEPTAIPPAQPAPLQPAPLQPAPGQAAPEQSAPEQPIPARQPSDAARPDADAVWA